MDGLRASERRRGLTATILEQILTYQRQRFTRFPKRAARKTWTNYGTSLSQTRTALFRPSPDTEPRPRTAPTSRAPGQPSLACLNSTRRACVRHPRFCFL